MTRNDGFIRSNGRWVSLNWKIFLHKPRSGGGIIQVGGGVEPLSLLPMQTDLHLLSRYHRHGDAEAFQSLVEAHAGMVHATARRVTRDAALAQDVAQETFLALARNSGTAIHSVGAWLHRVAWQKAQNMVRGESRRQSYEAAAAADLSAATDESTWTDLEPPLDEALGELPEPSRSFIIERYLEGRTQQEIAARMGMSQSSVSRQLDAAIHELRARLRMKGVFCGTSLAMLLNSHAAHAVPASLTASLGKVSISGLGASTVTTSSAAITVPLIAMTATKTLLLLSVVGVAGVAILMHPWTSKQSVHGPVQARPAAQKQTTETTSVDSGTKHYRPPLAPIQIQRAVDDILRRLAGMSPEEKKHDAELNRLMDHFTTVISSPAVATQVTERITTLRARGKKGTVTMDYDMLENPTGRAWLEAVVSNDEQLMEAWVLNTLDGAIFEFAFDPSLERTSNGVILRPGTTAKSNTNSTNQ